MPDRLSGCGCCDDTCRESTFYRASDWSAGTGGTVSEVLAGTPDGNEISLNGPVDPVSFIDEEAYQVDFALHSGKVTFSVDGETITADAINQTITVDGITIDAGRSTETPLHFPSVQLRVTPSFISLLVIGNYTEVGIYPPTRSFFGAVDDTAQGASHAILTVERDGTNPPTTFTCQWQTAVVSGFTIQSSQSTFGDTYGSEPDLICSTPLPDSCAYLALKTLSQNHLYRDNIDYERDLFVPDITLGGYDPYAATTTSGPGVLGTFLLDDDGNDHDLYSLPWEPPYDTARHMRAGNSFKVFGSRGFSDFGFDALYTRIQASKFIDTLASRPRCYVAISLDLGEPSPSNPYPLPVYKLNVDIDKQIVAQSDLAVNDLRNGFNIIASGTHPTYGQTMSIEWDMNP